MDAARGHAYVCNKVEEAGIDPDTIRDGVVLGSGLGSFAGDYMDEGAVRIPFNDIFAKLGIERSEGGVPGHAQQLIIGPLKDDSADRCVIAQAGREHPYEGVSTRRSTFWIHIMQLLGVETLLGSNAVGIVTPKTLPLPSLMLVHSHLDFGEDNPLVGHNDPEFGPRFPHSGDLYPAVTREIIKKVAQELGVVLPEGTLFRCKGPEYESAETIYHLRALLEEIWEQGRRQPGENRFGKFGGNEVGAVGMSSTFEHLVAQHASPNQGDHPNRAFGKGRAHFSVGTNYAAGLGPDGAGRFPTHEEVQESSRMVEDTFGKLVRESIIAMRQASAVNHF